LFNYDLVGLREKRQLEFEVKREFYYGKVAPDPLLEQLRKEMEEQATFAHRLREGRKAISERAMQGAKKH
jgi:hypothetical protein